MKVEVLAKDMIDALSNINEAVQTKRISAPANISNYKGFLLLRSIKGAAVLGFEHGHGVAFKVLGMDPDGTPQLSGPVIVKVSKVAVGLQLGFNSVSSLMLFSDEAQLEGLAQSSEAIIGKDLDISGMQHPDAPRAENTFHRTSMNAVGGGSHVEPLTLSISDSLMVCDVSMYGGSLRVAKETMKAAYGATYGSPLDVLHGSVATPESLQELVATTTSLIAALTFSKEPAKKL